MAITLEIPTIDVSPYLRPHQDAIDREKVIAEVKQACSQYGFLQIKGHGVPLVTQQAMLQSCRSLFDLPQDEKDAISLKNNPARRGYERIGEQTLDAKALPDSKEVLLVCVWKPW